MKEKLKPVFAAIKDYMTLLRITESFNDLDTAGSYWQPNESNVLLYDAPGGSKHHHVYRGGLVDHMVEMWEMGYQFYSRDQAILDFTLQDLAVVILIHDLSKGVAFDYCDDNNGYVDEPKFKYRDGFFDAMGYDNKTAMLLAYYGIKLTEQQFIGFLHTEAGYAEACISDRRRDGNMLSKFVNVLDMYSSQILGRKFPIK